MATVLMEFVLPLLLSSSPTWSHPTVTSTGQALDLTHPFSNELTIQWPTANKFNFTVLHRDYIAPDSFYYETNDFEQSEHAGTHMDAPAHFAKDKWRTDQIPFDRLNGPAVVVDFTEQTKKSLDSRVEVRDFESWERQHGRIPEGAVVLIHTGRGRHYNNRTEYLGYPPLRPGEGERDPKDVWNLHFPGFHPDAARWLTRERSVVGVGLDCPSLDYGPSSEFECHQIFGQANVWGLENVANLHLMPPTGYRVYAMVQKMKGGSGGPARILALPEDVRTSSSAAVAASARVLLLLAVIAVS